MSRKSVFLMACFFQVFLCQAQSNFSRGEEFLTRNEPSRAVPFLESAIADEPGKAITYLYLGIVYEQLGRNDEAIAIYRRALPIAGNLSANVANNLGNVYFQKGNWEEAERCYTQAIGFDSVFSRAYLGRANTRIKSGNHGNAISDYERYISLEPLSSQRSSIESLVSFIRAESASAETRRIMAEEVERVIAEERQRLLDSVSASLQSAADYSKSISSGAEGVENYAGEFELE